MNIYAKIILDELDNQEIKYELKNDSIFNVLIDDKVVTCYESLTSFIPQSLIKKINNKYTTLEKLHKLDINIPAQMKIKELSEAREFGKKYNSIVIKPNDLEQGIGISVNIKTKNEIDEAFALANAKSDDIIAQEYIEGIEYRVLIIDYEVVAIAKRIPAYIVGDGVKSIRELIEIKNEILNEKTQGESKIDIDSETLKILSISNLSIDSIVPNGESIKLKYIANLHKGGELIDETDLKTPLHKRLREDSIKATKNFKLPVCGVDFIVSDEGAYLIELNERPGLANHEPQPTAQKFVEFLIKHSRE